MNLQAGCGACMDLGAGSLSANFRFMDFLCLAVTGRWLGAGKSSEPDGREVSEPMAVSTRM